MCVTGSRWFLVKAEMTSSVFVKEQQEVELETITATGTGTTTLLTVSHVHTYGEEVLSSQTKPIPSNSLIHFFSYSALLYHYGCCEFEFYA